jgi:O-antigen ligase
MRWRRRIARTWLIMSVLWVLYVVTVFSYGEPASGRELMVALVPPAFLLFGISAVAWIAER